MKIFYMASSVFGGSEYYRMYQPAKHLREQQLHDTAYFTPTSLQQVKDLKPDVVVIYLQHSKEMLKAVKELQSLGIKVVYDIDDNLWCIHPDNNDGNFWTKERLEGAEKLIKQCDAVTTTTYKMSKLVRKFNVNTYIVPNLVENIESLDNDRPEDHKFRIGWHGSRSHAIDFFPEVVEPLLALQELRDVELVFCGYIPEVLVGKCRYMNAVDPKHFLSYIASFKLDVGIAPLANEHFNYFKSNLKFLEYSLLGIPTIATSITPYEGTTSILVKNERNEWWNALNRLIKHRHLLNTYGTEARQFVQKHYMIKNKIKCVAEVYETIRRQ